MNTPRTLSRRNSTSTFSTTLGLAKMLNERGIKAVTPSCVATPNEERNFTPTATPCNSPDGSPGPSRAESPCPSPSTSSVNPFGLLASGAELLMRTFGAEVPTPPPVHKSKRRSSKSSSKSEPTGRLVEKLERRGFDSIMATNPGGISPLALPGAIYTRRLAESPMAQLTFLKSSRSSECDESERVKSPEIELSRRPSVRQRRGDRPRTTRPDLGQVKTPAQQPLPPVTKESAAQTALGTLSTLLFGRKGGLL